MSIYEYFAATHLYITYFFWVVTILSMSASSVAHFFVPLSIVPCTVHCHVAECFTVDLPHVPGHIFHKIAHKNGKQVLEHLEMERTSHEINR